MEPALSSILVVMAHLALTLAAAVLYLRRARVERPPVGVFNRFDVAVLGVVLVVMPPLYLKLPTGVLTGIFAVMSGAILYFTLTPVIGGRRAAWSALALVTLDIALAELADGNRWIFDEVNNLILALILVGVCNIWAQSGIPARNVAALGMGLAVYDVVATLALPLMGDFLDRISSLPLAPLMAWDQGAARVGIGLGDLLLVVVWALVAEKAFSRRAGLAAAALGLAGTLSLFLAFWLDLVNRPLPAMVVLGPAMALQYRVLARRGRRERTTAEYLASLDGTTADASLGGPAQADLQAALSQAQAQPAGSGAGRYLALRSGEVVGSGTSVIDAVQSARQAGPGTVPVIVRVGAPEAAPVPG